MRLLATKWTPQIVAACIARIRHEKDPAIPARRQATPHLGLASDHGSQERVVFQHQPGDHAAPIPAPTVLEALLDPCGKNTKPSLSLLSLTT